MLTYLGSLTVSAAIPILFLMEGALVPILARLKAQLAGYVALALKIGIKPPSIGASAIVAAKILASLQVAVAPPSINFAASAVAALIAKLEAEIALLIPLVQFNATAGVHAFVYEGRVDSMGTAMVSVPVQTGLPPGTPVYATILLGQAGTGASVALKTIFKTP